MGALALNGSADFKKGFGPLLPDATEIPFGDLDALTKELRVGDVAAFIVEPIQGKGVYELDAERTGANSSGGARRGRALHL
jgi:ornithine--oxo-acid transaminase